MITGNSFGYVSEKAAYNLNSGIFCTGRRKSGPALGGTEYRLMPSACRLILRGVVKFTISIPGAPMRRQSIVVV